MDDLFFTSWPRIVTGALVLATMFGVLQVIGEAVLSGEIVIGRATLGLWGAAFWGYLLVGYWIHRNPRDADG